MEIQSCLTEFEGESFMKEKTVSARNRCECECEICAIPLINITSEPKTAVFGTHVNYDSNMGTPFVMYPALMKTSREIKNKRQS